MRSSDEIQARLKEIEKEDFFGFETSDLISALPYEAAKPHLEPEVTEDQWKPVDDEATREAIKNYMPFAIENAAGHRGLSATRSISHMRTWLWLLGDDELVTMTNSDDGYPQYGAPILKAICAKYELNWPDDVGINNMAMGRPCHYGCDEGCGQ